MRVRFYATAAWLAAATVAAHAGYGGMDNVEGDAGPVDFAVLLALLPGAAIGYFIERAYRKTELDKQGVNYSSEYLGGKMGAVIGAVGLPLIIGLFR